MAIIIKRSEMGGIRNECVYGCCTDVYGKNVPKVRRRLKRRGEQLWRRDLARSA